MIVATETRHTDPPDYKTSAEMSDICCSQKGALPCRETVTPWDGYGQEDVRKKLHLNDEVEIRYVARKNPCGELATKYDTTSNNCCDGVEQLAWDDDATPDVLARGSSLYAVFYGGRAPFSVSIRGNGFYLDAANTVRDMITGSRVVRIFANSAACGSAILSVGDGCSSAGTSIRSDLGIWTDYMRYCGETINFPYNPIQEWWYVGRFKYLYVAGKYCPSFYSPINEDFCDSAMKTKTCIPAGSTGQCYLCNVEWVDRWTWSC